jgi:fatty acid desaturase
MGYPPETMASLAATALVRDLCAVVRDLGAAPSPGERARASLRLTALSALLLGGAWLYWRLPLGGAAIGAVLIAGVAYGLLLIATHEMVHGTLLGYRALEQWLACLLSWPMAWPYLTYARLHHLHHRWNGCDPRDPERTTPLPQERLAAGPLRRLVQRHLLFWRVGVLGGVGLIADTARKGFWLQRQDQGLVQARFIDGAGVMALHTAMLLIAITQGELWRYLLFWLLLERVIGAIVQFRGLVEHHLLWRSREAQLLTQLYATRTINAGSWLNSLMGGLPHHGAHHAFPTIPSERLPLATRRIALVLERHGAPPLPTLPSYGEALRVLIAAPNNPELSCSAGLPPTPARHGPEK